ncbi:hypothetical protein GTZ78_34955 [Streptomyces sp. SID8361]|uniref:beta-galactosidase n=1 Tax=Streptomyces sp. MnatMP-M27 TaxID=1839768 RepID=UPI00081DAA3A|nr:hypothetical protein [Streptomyces sp. SID8361]SCG10191.1 beta-galactosidase [Streptomyces sp. MnatMP-M27]
MRCNALAHGADAIAYLPVAAAKASSEQWHWAMPPHAGTNSQTWQDVVQLGADLQAMTEARDSTVAADAAVVWTWNVRWALELPSRPSSELRFLTGETQQVPWAFLFAATGPTRTICS